MKERLLRKRLSAAATISSRSIGNEGRTHILVSGQMSVMTNVLRNPQLRSWSIVEERRGIRSLNPYDWLRKEAQVTSVGV